MVSKITNCASKPNTENKIKEKYTQLKIGIQKVTTKPDNRYEDK